MSYQNITNFGLTPLSNYTTKADLTQNQDGPQFMFHDSERATQFLQVQDSDLARQQFILKSMKKIQRWFARKVFFLNLEDIIVQELKFAISSNL